MDFAQSVRRAIRAVPFVLYLVVGWPNAIHAQEKSSWTRIVIIGASVSHGYTRDEPFGGPETKDLALDHYLDAALLAPHERPRNLANAMFFMLPDDMGHTQIRQALTNNPTLVIGVDFLFWFCYGRGETDQDRLDHFEKGLKLLEAIPCPLIIGDIPDASAALNRMISQREMPSFKVRTTANRRLKDWAAHHQQVPIVPLAGFMRAVAAHEALTVHGHILSGGATAALLQPDRLHPNQRGCALLAISILDTFLAAQPGLEVSQVRWDTDEVLQAAKSIPTRSPEPAEDGPRLKP
jgi:hypothetical protein